ncbi:MAG: ASKHA domain-containing protein, partial [Chloroflexota bacterium]
PSNKAVEVPRGTLLLDAAAKAGIVIETPCGAQGRCGRCLVKVEQGKVSHRDNPHLTTQQLKEGWVLSCVAQVDGYVIVAVPAAAEREKAAAETAASQAEATITCDWPFQPAVRQLTLQIPPPTLEENAADLDRLRRAVEGHPGIKSLAVELPELQKLAATMRKDDWQVTATVKAQEHEGEACLVDIWPGRRPRRLLGVAVDIGTTNVVIDLVGLKSGRFIDRVSVRNRQAIRGEDVISRIVYSERGSGLEELQQLVIGTINELLDELAREHNFEPCDIGEMVVAANTTMAHIFLGLPPKSIRQEPYVPTARSFPTVCASDLGLAVNPRASVYCLPAVAAYVGGDITAGVLSSCIYRSDKLSLFLDVGTNGELVLGNADWMATCACSSGPAFEGAGVGHGMRATKGAIEDVRINSQTLEPTVQTIGDAPPRGICGSGMISALAEMFLTGVIDRAGRMSIAYINERMGKSTRARMGEHGGEYVIVWARDSGTEQDIVLTDVDISNLIRTKAAIYAGVAVMGKNLGIPLSDIEEVLIGGAFGQHINVEAAIQIGLLPDLPWERFKYLGNTSAMGARMALLSLDARKKAEEIAGKMTYMELIADNSFMKEFTGGIFLPHTELERFPSVQRLFAESRQP